MFKSNFGDFSSENIFEMLIYYHIFICRMDFHSHITFAEGFWERMRSSDERHVHVVMIATKPDIIKQAPVYHALKKRGALVVLAHTGQHYDFNLSGGMLKEFGLEVDFNLGISGAYYEKVSQVIARLGSIFTELKSLEKIPVPYIHGDTMTAMAAGNAAYSCGIACVHNEAGIRTLTPKKQYYKKLAKEVNEGNVTEDILEWWIALHSESNNFEKGSMEPNPEQFNTRCSEPASGIFLAPVEITKQFLGEEGYSEERIFVVGNSVVDATRDVLKGAEKSTIFEKYPLLQEGAIRFCIHRRENCEDETRFKAIFEGMKQCVDAGIPTLLISLFATEAAIDRFGLREEMNRLKEKENFIYSEVWPYYTDVIGAMKAAACIVTDSGSMQEECNELGVPCVTLRFGSDRGESFFAGGNLLAPPISGDFIAALVQKVVSENLLRDGKKIYGENVSEKVVNTVLSVLEKNENILMREEERIFGNED